MAATCFGAELSVYEANLARWLSEGLEGKFAVIKGNEVVGIAQTHEDALRLGIRKTRSREFLIQRIRSTETVEWLSHVE